MNRFTTSLHTHVRSQFDAHIEPSDLIKRIEEMGGKGIAITDHGVLSSIEDYRTEFEKHGLKIIPGCEVYVANELPGRHHLVLLAVNDHGYHGLCKIVTESNRHMDGQFPVIPEETLFSMMEEYKGEILALTACMQGVVCSVYLLNEELERKIAKIRGKQEKYTDPGSAKVAEVMAELEKAQSNYDECVVQRDETKRMADQKFVQREKKVAKMEEKSEAGATEARAELEADKKAAEDAKKKLPQAVAALEAAKKALSASEKANKSCTESVDKYLELEAEIEKISAEIKSDEELEKMAEQKFTAYVSAFGKENIYAEMQYHGIEQEAVVFPKLAKLARKHGVQLVATNDVHILRASEEDRLKRQILRSLRFGEKFEEEQVGDAELYLKDDTELAEFLSKILPKDVVEEAISNIEVVFNRCDVKFCTEKHYPVFSKTGDANAILEDEIRKGIRRRFPDGMDEEHQKRLQYELKIIEDMGYANYHLVVKDFLEYGHLLGAVPKNRIEEAPLTIAGLKAFIQENGWKNYGMLTGPGRGSAVGSLVCYLLGITALDPLKYGLLFERFLNPERISMPDIDSDLANATRGKVIKYVQNKYGNMAVCGIMTTNALAPKGAFDVAARFYGLKTYGESMLSLGRSLAEAVPSDVGTSFSTTVSAETGAVDPESDLTLLEYLKARYAGNKDALEIIRWASIIEGSFTAYGAHAAGIVISDNDDVSDYIPLRMNTTLGMFTTQCNMVQVEDNGLLKFDFLGLKTLDIITETLRMIEENYGIIIDPLKIDIADKKVYDEILSVGKTNSVFQFESNGMKTMLKRFKPECFEDLIILVSMFRPGPLQYLDGVIDVKNGKAPMTFLVPQLKPILGKTYGAIVYQEQVMEICRSLAGFTFGHADQVRRYMSKKKADKLAAERDAFVSGCGKNGVQEKEANILFDQMMDFASYAFNKSHAAAYAYNAYITAWLKCYYPAEFFASALNWAPNNKKISGLMYEAKSCGVKVLPPDINRSMKEFSVVDGAIRFGLGQVAGVKNNADDILEERQRGRFISLKDYCRRTKVSSKVTENLISAGAFDEFGTNRAAMKQLAADLKDCVSEINKKESFIASAEYLLPKVEMFCTAEEIQKAQQDAGLKVEIKEPTTAERLNTRIANAKEKVRALYDQLNLMHEVSVQENPEERMATEKELLGMYVTKHPLDLYPSAEELGISPIADLQDGKCTIYGVVTNLQEKKRKSDGASMAVFTLEDKSSSVEVVVFVKAYSACATLLKEGAVLKVYGNCEIEENEDDETVKFFLEKAYPIQMLKSKLIMEVSSYASFHLDVENAFREAYEEKDGHTLLIFDKALDEFREAAYKVSDAVKVLPGVVEQ